VGLGFRMGLVSGGQGRLKCVGPGQILRGDSQSLISIKQQNKKQGYSHSSITLTHRRVRPPVWIILLLHIELASVRALLSKALITLTSHPLSNLCAMYLFADGRTIKIQEMPIQILTNTYQRRARTHTHTHPHALLLRPHAQHESMLALHAKAHARMLMLAQGCESSRLLLTRV